MQQTTLFTHTYNILIDNGETRSNCWSEQHTARQLRFGIYARLHCAWVRGTKPRGWEAREKSDLRSLIRIDETCSFSFLIPYTLYDSWQAPTKIRMITKNHDLPAPTPIKPTIKHFYGDYYAPVLFKSYEPKKSVEVQYLSRQKYEIRCILHKGRHKCKREIMRRICSVILKANAEDRDDMIKLFIGQKNLLPLELARGFSPRQSTDERWQRDLRAAQLKNLPEEIKLKERYAKKHTILENLRAYTRPGPSPLAKEFHPEINSPRISCSDSSASTSTNVTDKTLVEDGADDTGVMENVGEIAYDHPNTGTQSDTEIVFGGDEPPHLESFPLTRAVARTGIKKKRTKSIYPHYSKMSGTCKSIRRRIRRLARSSKK